MSIRETWIASGLNEHAVVAGDMATNFWREEANFGEERAGICGPHTEVFYDRGEAFGCMQDMCGPHCQCGRFLEIANIVFITARQQANGRFVGLTRPLVACGLGIEWIAMILQLVLSIWEVDSVVPLLEWIKEKAMCPSGTDDVITGSSSPAKPEQILADRVRAAVALLADGARPGPKGRSHVVRRVFRSLWAAACNLCISDKEIMNRLFNLALDLHYAEHNNTGMCSKKEVLFACVQELQRLNKYNTIIRKAL